MVWATCFPPVCGVSLWSVFWAVLGQMFSHLVVACGFGLSFGPVDHYIDCDLVLRSISALSCQWTECFPSLRGWRVLSDFEVLGRWAEVL